MAETGTPTCMKCGDPITSNALIAYETLPLETMGAEPARVLGNRVNVHAQCYPSHQGYAFVKPGADRCGTINEDQVCVHVPHEEGTPHLFEQSSMTPMEGPLELR